MIFQRCTGDVHMRGCCPSYSPHVSRPMSSSLQSTLKFLVQEQNLLTIRRIGAGGFDFRSEHPLDIEIGRNFLVSVFKSFAILVLR